MKFTIWDLRFTRFASAALMVWFGGADLSAQSLTLSDPAFLQPWPLNATVAAPTADLLHYTLNENTGTNLTDISAGAHNGSIRSNTDWRVGLNGSAGHSVTNSGTTGTAGNYIRSTAAVTLNANNQITVSFWANVISPWAASKMLFESSTNFNNNSYTCAFYAVSSSAVELALNDNGANYYTEDYTAPSTGATHHFVCQFDNSTTQGAVHFYVDGVLQTKTSTPNNNRINTANFANEIIFFGSRNSGSSQSEPTHGTFDDVAIFSGLLSGAQITALYNAGPQ